MSSAANVTNPNIFGNQIAGITPSIVTTSTTEKPQNVFGTSQTTNSIFGKPPSVFGETGGINKPMFELNSTPSNVTSAFTQPQTENKSIFGQSTPAVAFASNSTSTFGNVGANTATANKGSIFGNNNPGASQTNSNVFAPMPLAPSSSGSNMSQNTSVFGNSQNTSVFGNSQSTSLFGTSQNTSVLDSSHDTSVFGGSQNTSVLGGNASQSGSIFGSSQSTSILGGSQNTPVFGSGATNQQTSTFGNIAAPTPQNTTSMFGNPQAPSAAPSGGGFSFKLPGANQQGDNKSVFNRLGNKVEAPNPTPNSKDMFTFSGPGNSAFTPTAVPTTAPPAFNFNAAAPPSSGGSSSGGDQPFAFGNSAQPSFNFNAGSNTNNNVPTPSPSFAFGGNSAAPPSFNFNANSPTPPSFSVGTGGTTAAQRRALRNPVRRR